MGDYEITIRSAVPEDAPDIARIWLEGVLGSSGKAGPPFDEAVASFRDRIVKCQAKSGIWVAVADGVILGWQGLQHFGVTQISQIAQSSTYVSRERQMRGVGQRLLEYGQAQASELELDLIVGWIKTDNHSSLRLVNMLGWTCVGILPRNSETDPELAYYAYAVPRI